MFKKKMVVIFLMQRYSECDKKRNFRGYDVVTLEWLMLCEKSGRTG